MESTSQNNNNNAIKEVRELFNEIRNNLVKRQRELENNSIKRKLSTSF